MKVLTESEAREKWRVWDIQHGWDPDRETYYIPCACGMTASICPTHSDPMSICFGVIPSGTVCMHGNTKTPGLI